MSENEEAEPRGVGGWLLILCILLTVWGPLELSVVAASALRALPVRGPSLGALLVLRVAVAAVGLAAGLALFARRGHALALARTALVMSGVADVFVYLTPYFPNNRMPGDDVFYVIGAVLYSTVWLAYLARSTRVRNTFG